MINEDNQALQSWLAGAQEKINVYFAEHFKNLTPGKLSITAGPRYFRIVNSNSGCFAFIDRLNGDVLKAASWKAPAKHARGNIFDASNGLEFVDHHGPKYLR